MLNLQELISKVWKKKQEYNKTSSITVCYFDARSMFISNIILPLIYQ